MDSCGYPFYIFPPPSVLQTKCFPNCYTKRKSPLGQAAKTHLDSLVLNPRLLSHIRDSTKSGEIKPRIGRLRGEMHLAHQGIQQTCLARGCRTRDEGNLPSLEEQLAINLKLKRRGKGIGAPTEPSIMKS